MSLMCHQQTSDTYQQQQLRERAITEIKDYYTRKDLHGIKCKQNF